MRHIIQSILKKQMLLLIVLLILLGVFEYFYIMPAKILGVLIDLLSNIEENKNLLIQNLKYMLLVSAGIIIFGVLTKYLLAVSVRYFERDLRNTFFKSFLKLKLTDIQDVKNGEIMSYFVKDIGEIDYLLYRIEHRFVKMCFAVIFALYCMKNVNIILTISVLIPLIITVICILFFKKSVAKSFKKSQKYFTTLSEFVQESTDSIRTSKAYAGEISGTKKFLNRNKILMKSDILVDKYSTLVSIAVSLCLGISYGIILLYGSHLVIKGLITTGDLVAFTGYIDTLFLTIFWIPGLISKWERGKISFNRLDRIIKLEKEINSFSGKEFKDINGDIVIENLSFKYPKSEKNVLKNIDLNIPKGTTLGIIGTIGSGKTTLVNLLTRLYKVHNNKIYIGENDINDIDVMDLRNSVCYITQDNFLFSTTIKDNIRLFKDIYEIDEIQKSTRKAMLVEDLSSMKSGIDTVIGERGIELSGGQKQRVVIARAFLDKANIVIFDDIFSALDNKTEEEILKNIKEITKNKTCIIVSNRISDVKDADNIIVLDEGEIIEQGTHKELISNDNLYSRFYREQASII